jgi:alpha-L-fucosidase
MKPSAKKRTPAQAVKCNGPFTANWSSLVSYKIPKWYQDAKFGVFIHWGVYSVPAFGNEWYPRNMYFKGTAEFDHHVKTYGPQSRFGYKDFIPLFKAEKFDPVHWAQLFRRAGARFVMPVAEHHDGFAMYDTALSRWNAVQMGPKRDLIGDLAEAVRKEGMTFTLSSHRAEHWWFFGRGREFDSDVRRGQFEDFYGPAHPLGDNEPVRQHRKTLPFPDTRHLEDWLTRCCELVDKYRPQIFYFDWWIQHVAFDSYLQKFAAYYYNRAAQWGQGVAINYKHDAFPEGAAVFDVERGQLNAIREKFWQTDTAVSKNSWGYVKNQDYKTATTLIGDLVDIVSKNGALLLNIGPRPDGTIPEPEERLLMQIGDWLAVNGEAIYGTRPGKIFGEGPTEIIEGNFNDVKRAAFTAQDYRFTRKGKNLYVIALGWPTDGILRIKTLAPGGAAEAPRIQKIELLGARGPLKWKRDRRELAVTLPEEKPCEHAFVLKLGF